MGGWRGGAGASVRYWQSSKPKRSSSEMKLLGFELEMEPPERRRDEPEGHDG